MKCAALFVFAGVLVLAQNRPSFEVATIKPTPSGELAISFNTSPEGRITAHNYTLFRLILATFGEDLQESQVSGGPAWIKTRGFDIQAQTAAGFSKADVPRMLQTLLEDRFQLKWHWQSPERSVYALTIAPGGPKLARAREGRMRVMFGDIDMPSVNLDMLRQIVEGEVGRPVLNQTGLTGDFAVTLQWTSERAPNPDRSKAALATALQEQLGLKLESVKAVVRTLVIDSVNEPSEN